ncbi:MAG: hypothetical protein NVS4B11_03010 [Ktedonobacteraceae bacterium]
MDELEMLDELTCMGSAATGIYPTPDPIRQGIIHSPPVWLDHAAIGRLPTSYERQPMCDEQAHQFGKHFGEDALLLPPFPIQFDLPAIASQH